MNAKSDDKFICKDWFGHLFDGKGRKLVTIYPENLGSPLESSMTFRNFKDVD